MLELLNDTNLKTDKRNGVISFRVPKAIETRLRDMGRENKSQMVAKILEVIDFYLYLDDYPGPSHSKYLKTE